MGTWLNSEEIPDSQNRPKAKLPLEVGEGFIAEASLLADRFNIKPGFIYYPCSGTDISPTKVFPGARIIFADQNERCVVALAEAGFEAHAASAVDFNPGIFDLLVLMNPQVHSTLLASRVTKGAHIICNNFHGTADQLKENLEFKYLGTVGALSAFEKI